MGRQPLTSEQIVGLLQEADARLARGINLGQICRELGITQESYYRCRTEYGGMKASRGGSPGDSGRVKNPPGKEEAARALDGPVAKKSLGGKP